MFKFRAKETPTIFDNLFSLTENKYSTRSSSLYYKPFCKTKFAQFLLSYQAPCIWNEYFVKYKNLIDVSSFHQFKTNAKQIILSAIDVNTFF
jgi:hypothetical protein